MKIMNFKNKIVLAPMVRVSTLPLRLLSLKFGADYVYSEEIVDFKILRSVRIENDVLGTIDYVMDDGTVVFRTCEEEKGRIVFQLATNNADRALEVGKKIQNDVAAIDLNMGCPKGYSTKGGMGAAMLKDPDNACKILKNLSDNLEIPITCKIRILPKLETTIELVSKLSATGIVAIAVHGRYPEERPRNLVHDDIIKKISDFIGNKITVLANGGSSDFIKTYDDIEYFKQCCGVTSVMIGRAAMWNPSIFKKQQDHIWSSHEIIKEYLKYVVRYDNHLSSSKYCITQFLNETTECPGFRETLNATCNKELCDIWDVMDLYKNEVERRKMFSNEIETPIKKMKFDENSGEQVQGTCKFNKRLYGKTGWSPKLALMQYCDKMKWSSPKFSLLQDEATKLFYCSILLNNILYTNAIGDKNKRFTEQATSCICLKKFGLITQDLIDKGLKIESL